MVLRVTQNCAYQSIKSNYFYSAKSPTRWWNLLSDKLLTFRSNSNHLSFEITLSFQKMPTMRCFEKQLLWTVFIIKKTVGNEKIFTESIL